MHPSTQRKRQPAASVCVFTTAVNHSWIPLTAIHYKLSEESALSVQVRVDGWNTTWWGHVSRPALKKTTGWWWRKIKFWSNCSPESLTLNRPRWKRTKPILSWLHCNIRLCLDWQLFWKTNKQSSFECASSLGSAARVPAIADGDWRFRRCRLSYSDQWRAVSRNTAIRSPGSWEVSWLGCVIVRICLHGAVSCHSKTFKWVWSLSEKVKNVLEHGIISLLLNGFVHTVYTSWLTGFHTCLDRGWCILIRWGVSTLFFTLFKRGRWKAIFKHPYKNKLLPVPAQGQVQVSSAVTTSENIQYFLTILHKYI